MKKYTYLLLLFVSLHAQSQALFPPLENSFNCPYDFFPYNSNMVTTPELPVFGKIMRLMGGSSGELATINQDDPYEKPDVNIRNFVYATRYKGFNFKNSRVWPAIKTLTEDLTRTASVQWVLPIANDYQNPIRPELLAKYQLLDGIATYEQFMASPLFSAEWKAVVKDKMDMYNAFVNNMVSIPYIEFNNESYSDDGQGVLNFTGNYPGLIWSRTNNTPLSLLIHDKVCSFYARIFRAKDANLKFFMPIATDIYGGFATWNLHYMNKEVAASIGIDGYVIHYYPAYTNTTDPATAYSRLLTAHNNHIAYVQAVVLPLIGNKMLTYSEFSNSENNPCLRGNDYDRKAYLNLISLFRTIPNIVSDHLHAYSNGVQLGCAFKMNGSTKPGQWVVNPTGQGFLDLKKLGL